MANPVNVGHLLKTRFKNYAKGEFFSLLLHDLLGTGIFDTVNGKDWKLQRRVVSCEFSTRSLRDFIEETVQKESANCLLSLLRKYAVAATDEGNKRWLSEPTSGCLDISLPFSKFAEAFNVATDLIVKRFVHPLPFTWKVMRMLNVGYEKHLREAIHAVHNFAEG
ncbi:hypothetical protein KI387_039850, partial [Taxus chinensis]